MPREIRGRAFETHLVEVQRVEKFVQLPVFTDFVQLDVVLLQPVEGEFRLVIDKDFKRLMIKVVPSIMSLAKQRA